MEHTCYRCGQPVEEGVAFCDNCHAPQIRVAVPPQEQVGANQPATGPILPGTPDEVQPPARPVAFGYGAAPSQAGAAGQQLKWHDAIPGAMLAGSLIALVLILPLAAYILCPLVAGALAVLFYRRRQPGVEITPGAGARIGAVAGLFSFILFSVLMGIEMAAMSGSGALRASMMQALQQSAARNPSPEAQQMAQKLMTPEGIAVMVVIVFVIFLVMFVALSSAGGALGAKIMRKKE